MENKDHDGRSGGWAVRGKNEEKERMEREGGEREGGGGGGETDRPIRPHRQIETGSGERGGEGGRERRGGGERGNLFVFNT